jgi:hypothetical protein
VSAAKLSRNERQTRRHAEHEIVYLVAPSGNPNYGDEFILRAWLRYLARVRPEADVVVDCHTPGQAAVLLRAWHPRVTLVDTIWRICFDTAHLPPTEAIAVADQRHMTSALEQSLPGDRPAVLSELPDCDLNVKPPADSGRMLIRARDSSAPDAACAIGVPVRHRGGDGVTDAAQFPGW